MIRLRGQIWSKSAGYRGTYRATKGPISFRTRVSAPVAKPKYREGRKRDQKRGGIGWKLKGKCGPAG